jgi:formylglycine-generating enzyme required for sulfatase activity
MGDMQINSIGMQLVLVPEGDFLMGSLVSEIGRDANEKQHRVEITKPFYLGSTEVTQSQWTAVMGTLPWKGQRYVKLGADFPATYVTWDEAMEFCQKLSEKEGALYRLPTEAEWEYACRAGTTTRYHFGDDEAQLGDYAWFTQNAKLSALLVGKKKANAWGLYDMHGNVIEWCDDGFSERFYESSQLDDPQRRPSTTDTQRVCRGGGWGSDSGACRSAKRDKNNKDYRGNGLGFRVLAVPLEVRGGSSIAVASANPFDRTSDRPAPAVAPFDTIKAKAHQEAWAKYLGTAVESTNSVGAKMVLIPPGQFERVYQTGQTSSENYLVVLTKPILMGATEVTAGQFRKFRTSSVNEPDEFPASGVMWDDAVAFCNWLSERENRKPCYRQEGNQWVPLPTGDGYRLPTEAEWEFSCRAGTTTKFSFGEDESQLQDYAWYGLNSGGKSQPVGTRLPNSFGLYDMHGNLNEWCQDFYVGASYYQQSPMYDPAGPSMGRTLRAIVQAPGSTTRRVSYRVIRGGSWIHGASNSSSVFRTQGSASSILSLTGFRYVRVW